MNQWERSADRTRRRRGDEAASPRARGARFEACARRAAVLTRPRACVRARAHADSRVQAHVTLLTARRSPPSPRLCLRPGAPLGVRVPQPLEVLPARGRPHVASEKPHVMARAAELARAQVALCGRPRRWMRASPVPRAGEQEPGIEPVPRVGDAGESLRVLRPREEARSRDERRPRRVALVATRARRMRGDRPDRRVTGRARDPLEGERRGEVAHGLARCADCRARSRAECLPADCSLARGS